MTTLRQRTFWSAFVAEPVSLAISQPHQVAISSISVSLMAIFFGGSGVVPWAAAVAGAIGVEYAYLKGMSDAAYTESPWGARLIKAAFAIIVIAGTSVLLKDAYHVDFMVDPHPAWALVLALLHILPLAYLGLCSANLHIEAEARRVRADRQAVEQAEADRLAARQRQLERERAEEERQRRRADALDEIERQRLLTQSEIEAEKLKGLARLEYRQARVKFDTSEAPVKGLAGASQSGEGRLSKTERLDALLTLVRQAGGVKEIDVSKAAAHLGVSRQTVYNDIKALEKAGRLP